MTGVFLDTDVIVDYLTDRKPFSDGAETVFALIDNKKIKGYASSLSFSNLYYLLSKNATHRKVITKLNDLADFVGILKVDEDIIKAALRSAFKDFEDAIQYYTAVETKRIDIIITRNIKDYKHSTLPVMAPDTFLKTYEQIANI